MEFSPICDELKYDIEFIMNHLKERISSIISILSIFEQEINLKQFSINTQPLEIIHLLEWNKPIICGIVTETGEKFIKHLSMINNNPLEILPNTFGFSQLSSVSIKSRIIIVMLITTIMMISICVMIIYTKLKK